METRHLKLLGGGGGVDTCLWLRAEGHEDQLGYSEESQASSWEMHPQLSDTSLGLSQGKTQAVLSNNLNLAPSRLPLFVFPSWMNERQNE